MSKELLIKGGHVVTVDPDLGDLPAGDVLSERAGLWYPEVAPGTWVAEGTRLGRLEDPLGEVVQEILAPAAGVLVFGLGSLAAVQGSLLAFIARPVPTT